MDKTFNKMCSCENCGNESEMVITCSQPELFEGIDEDAGSKTEDSQPEKPMKVKGTATCTNCGNEADMWIEY